jgi:hypothetical protein
MGVLKKMNKDVQEHKIPVAVSVKPVLGLIGCATGGDAAGVKEYSLEIAKELELNGEEELVLWILAQLGMVPTFQVDDREFSDA